VCSSDLFPHRGAIGEVGIVPDNEPKKFILSTSLMKLTCNTKIIDPLFLFYFFRSSIGRQELLKNASTVGTPGIATPLNSLRSIEVPVPPLSDQQNIARILGSLDDKIELNRQMNETLETIARAIFQSWFVDFDPVWAKVEGRDTGLPSEIAALFPDGFEEVDGREVPRGWGVKPLSDSFNIKMGQSPPGTTYNENGEGIPFFQGRTDFGFRYPSIRVYCTAPTRFAEEGDTLVSVRAPVGDINLTQEKCCIGRGVAAVRHKMGSRSFTYYQMRSFKDIFALFESEGTVFGSIAKTDFNSIECITPPDEIVKKFEEIVFPIDQMIENNEKQSGTLAQIRDALLPKLMSGELRVDNNSS
jgi:type I restriction enzyme S subunit